MSELLFCPFCGGEAETWDGAGPWHVVCTECGTIGSPCLSEAEAIAAWNSRADYHGYEQAAIEAWQNVKAYKERTCHDINIDLANAFECSMCGFMASTSFGQFEYCPGCGAKVVGE